MKLNKTVLSYQCPQKQKQKSRKNVIYIHFCKASHSNSSFRSLGFFDFNDFKIQKTEVVIILVVMYFGS